jgi:hypothetical protein
VWRSSFPSSICEEAVFPLSCVLSSFVEDKLAVDVCVYVWVFYSDILAFLSVFVPVGLKTCMDFFHSECLFIFFTYCLVDLNVIPYNHIDLIFF